MLDLFSTQLLSYYLWTIDSCIVLATISNELYISYINIMAIHLLILLLFLLASSSSTLCSGNASFPYEYGGVCYGSCPWSPTATTYSDTSTLICTTSTTIHHSDCASGTFADDSTRTCASSTPIIYLACPSSPVQTYKDTSRNACVQNCSTNPSEFPYQGTCYSNCPGTTFADEITRQCVDTCPVGTYYQAISSVRICVARCNQTYFANLTKFCVVALDCPTSNVVYYGDDSTNLCVQGNTASSPSLSSHSQYLRPVQLENVRLHL